MLECTIDRGGSRSLSIVKDSQPQVDMPANGQVEDEQGVDLLVEDGFPASLNNQSSPLESFADLFSPTPVRLSQSPRSPDKSESQGKTGFRLSADEVHAFKRYD